MLFLPPVSQHAFTGDAACRRDRGFTARLIGCCGDVQHSRLSFGVHWLGLHWRPVQRWPGVLHSGVRTVSGAVCRYCRCMQKCSSRRRHNAWKLLPQRHRCRRPSMLSFTGGVMCHREEGNPGEQTATTAVPTTCANTAQGMGAAGRPLLFLLLWCAGGWRAGVLHDRLWTEPRAVLGY